MSDTAKVLITKLRPGDLFSQDGKSCTWRIEPTYKDQIFMCLWINHYKEENRYGVKMSITNVGFIESNNKLRIEHRKFSSWSDVYIYV